MPFLRFGVASRLNAGLFTMIVLMMGGGVLSLLTTGQFRDGMDRVSGDYIPTLIGTSLLAQQSHSIVANAPSLVVADSDFVRRSVADRIADQGLALTELRERLEQHGVGAGELAAIDGLHKELIDNLRRLDTVVGERIELNRRVQAMMGRLIRLPARLTAFATEDGRETPPLTAWMGDAQHAVGLMLSALGTPTGRRFEGLRQETATLLDQLQRRTTALPPGTITPASAILAEMRGVSDGDDGLFATQERLSSVSATIQHLLLANRELSNNFVAKVGSMARGVEARALDTSQGLSRDAARTGLVLLAAIAASLIAAAAVIAYINRNVVRRLVQVRDRVLSHVDATAADATPQRAKDEIADIGAAMDFFLAEIDRREEDLRAAKDAAEHALAELSRTQDSLIQSEKMAALGQLVAGVAHEINTPLGNALTSASYLADETERIATTFRTGPLRRSEFDRYLSTATETNDILLANIGRAADLVHSFKQVAVDQSTDERRCFHLRHYLDEVMQSLKPAWRKGGHQVIVECPPDIEIDGPPGAWSQIITNLVMNSLVHAYDEGQAGTLSIRVTLAGGGDVELVYADDGRGIPAASRDKVFDPFFTTRRGAGSTGLGLHIVYNLITRTLGGRIDLESPPPGSTGCRFRIVAPRVAPADKHAAGAAAP